MLILASLSPRRKELLSLITKDFVIVPPLCGEDLPEGVSPEQAVQMLSRRKALCVKAAAGDTVIGADTVVALDGEIIGKPESRKNAIDILTRLSGRTHEVFTGVTIVRGGAAESFFCRTAVRFRALPPAEIAAYAATGEPMDKAGAYGIQGGAAAFVENVTGDYNNVVGLPVDMLRARLGNL